MLVRSMCRTEPRRTLCLQETVSCQRVYHRNLPSWRIAWNRSVALTISRPPPRPLTSTVRAGSMALGKLARRGFAPHSPSGRGAGADGAAGSAARRGPGARRAGREAGAKLLH